MGEGWERGVVHICIASVVHYIIIYFASDGSFGCTYRVGKRSSGSGYGILRWLPLYNTEIQTVDHSDYRFGACHSHCTLNIFIFRNKR